MAEKLVRDLIPKLIRESGGVGHVRKADGPEEFKRFLIMKLQEEVREFTENPSIEELADIQEVVIHLSEVLGGGLNTARMDKANTKGGFSERYIWKTPDVLGVLSESEMRRVILSRAYEGPGACDPEKFGWCACDPSKGKCIHQTALHWHTQLHNPDNYQAREYVDRELKNCKRLDLKEVFDKACIGLSREEIQTVGDALLRYLGR